MLKFHFLIITASIVVIGVILWLATPEQQEAYSREVYFPTASISILDGKTKELKADYTVEVASNFMQRQQGLQHRKFLKNGHGMLFLFGVEDHISMWMKDTYIPLDIVFMNKSGHIISIYPNAIPGDTTRISAGMPAYAVLEIAAGNVAKQKVEIGDIIKHEAFH